MVSATAERITASGVTSHNVTSNGVTLPAMFLAAARPAAGAPLDQVAIAPGAAMLVTFLLLWLGMGHRSGRVPVLARLGKFSQRVSGLPSWAAIPAGIIVVSL